MPSAKRRKGESWSSGVRADALLLCAACCVVGGTVGCGFGGDGGARGAAPAVAPPEHVIIVTVDTLRADRLGCYGNAHVATPNIDRLAREGAIAPQTTVPAATPPPPHASVFSRLPP